MEKMMHLAAQYLAAAGINFVDKKDDDSHTNLGFSIVKQQLETHPLSVNGDVLVLNYKTFSLEWISAKTKDSFLLNDKTHTQVLEWLVSSADTFLGKKYTYGFHYDLPYSIEDSFTYKLEASELKKLAGLRTLAQISIEKTLKETELESTVRIWPHHFDSGAYASLTADIAVGFGLAVPDSMVNEHYFYISGYKGHSGLDTSNFDTLSIGEWKNEGFKGAVLPSSGVSETEVIQFFIEAINAYKK